MEIIIQGQIEEMNSQEQPDIPESTEDIPSITQDHIDFVKEVYKDVDTDGRLNGLTVDSTFMELTDLCLELEREMVRKEYDFANSINDQFKNNDIPLDKKNHIQNPVHGKITKFLESRLKRLSAMNFEGQYTNSIAHLESLLK